MQAPLAQPSLAHWSPMLQAWPGTSRHWPIVAPIVPHSYLAAAQSAAVVHVVSHAVALAHLKFPGQAPAVPALHVPLPLHAAAGVSVLPEHFGVPHVVPAA
jgi:hypothetical protein